MNFLRKGFQKLSYYQYTDRKSDATEIIHRATLQAVNNSKKIDDNDEK